MIKLKIVTPEKLILEEEVYSVTLPGAAGEVTILPDHVPYVGMIKTGELYFRREADAEPEPFATAGGFVEFHENTLSVLADTAERPEEIDIKAAEEAALRAEEAMKSRVSMDDEEYARVATALEREFSRLKVARKHASKPRVSLGGE
jgi:F-type H+-transporting ATPase subunit epsilon